VNLEQPVGGNGPRFALQLERRDCLHLDGTARQSECFRSEQYLARLRCLLEARCDVDRVARRQALLRSRHDLAGRDPDSSAESELGDGLPHLGRGPQGTQGIVLVQRRHPEDRHHRVPDELLDRPPWRSRISRMRSK